MESWDDAVAELRAEYLREAAGRLEEIDRLLDALSRDATDEASFRELLRRFHGFAGSGTTYGFPRVTQLGREGESTCMAAGRRAAGEPTPQELAGWEKVTAGPFRSLVLEGDHFFINSARTSLLQAMRRELGTFGVT